MPHHSLPDPDRLLSRVEDDLANNRAWHARHRLTVYVSRFAEEPRYGLRLGELMMEIEEWPNAGKAFIEGGSIDEQHQALMADQLKRMKDFTEFRKLIRNCLKRVANGAELPASISDAIQERGLALEEEIEWACRVEKPSDRHSVRSNSWVVLGIVSLGLFTVVMILGVKSLLGLF